jgi:hypothetical protein
MEPSRGIGTWGSQRRQTLLALTVIVMSAFLVVLAMLTFSADRSRSIEILIIVGVGMVVLAVTWVLGTRSRR